MAAVAALALVVAPSALAGPSLRVGAVEDAAIWGNPSVEMERARQAGFDSVRMTVQWSAGSNSPTHALITKVRSACSAAVARGIQPIVSIYNTSSTSTPADDVSRAQFVQFVRNVVASLPQVSTFIVGNEPNSNYYWLPQFDSSGHDAAASAYEQLLAASYDTIKAIRPNATVIGGALDPRGTDDPSGSKQTNSPTTFIRDLGAAYRASGRTAPIMDVFDEHVYADNSSLPPSMPHASKTVAEADYTKLVALLGAAFDGTAQRGSTLPILYGEFGVESTIPVEKSRAYSGAEPDSSGAVDEATQARYYTEAFKLALCQAARAGTLAICPDKTAPAVTIAAPAADGTIAGTATDDVGVGRVDLVVNGTVVSSKYTEPYSFVWKPAQPGRYALELRAYDGSGNVGRAELTVGAVRANRGDASTPARWLFGPPPLNDLFTAPAGIASWHGLVLGSTAFASSDRGEPLRRSVWFTWRAPADGPLKLSVGDAHISVYTGSSFATLQHVLTSGNAFDAHRGTTYRIAVDGGRGAFALAWSR